MQTLLDAWNLAGHGILALARPLAVQCTILVALLLLLERTLGNRLRPQFRYALWLLVPLKLLLPPSLALPSSPAYWLPHSASIPAHSVISKVPTDSPDPATEPTLIAKEPNIEASSFTLPSQYQPTTVVAAPIQATPAAAAMPPRPPFLLAGVALFLWVLGTVGLLLWLLAKTRQHRRLTAEAVHAPAHLLQSLNQARSRLGIRRSVGLRLIDDGLSPALSGLWRPVVLLPRGLAGRLSDVQLQAVLLHELAHARRADLWVHALQTVLQLVWWWHPFVWLANARLRAAREEVVDDTVAFELGPEDESYPSALLEVAKSALARPVPGLGLLGIVESRSALRTRIERLLDSPPTRPPRLGATGVAVVLGAGLLLLPMARGTVQPAAAPADRAPVSATADASLGRVSQEPPRSTGSELELRTTPPTEPNAPPTASAPQAVRGAAVTRGTNTTLARLVPPWAPEQVVTLPALPASSWPDWPDPLPGADEVRTGSPDALVTRSFFFDIARLQAGLEHRAGAALDTQQLGAVLRSQLEIAGFPLQWPNTIFVSGFKSGHGRMMLRGTGVEVAAAERVIAGLLAPPTNHLHIEARLLAFGPETVSALGLVESTNSPSAEANYNLPLVRRDGRPPIFTAEELATFRSAVAQRPEVETVVRSCTVSNPGREVELTLRASSTNPPPGLSLQILPEWTLGREAVQLILQARSTLLVDLRKDAPGATQGTQESPPATKVEEESGVYAVNAQGYINTTLTNRLVMAPGQGLLLAAPSHSEVVRMVDKVVVLGDMPVIGRLFRQEATSTRTRYEMVLVTATWVTPSHPPAAAE